MGGGSVWLCREDGGRAVLSTGRLYPRHQAHRCWVELWQVQWQGGPLPQELRGKHHRCDDVINIWAEEFRFETPVSLYCAFLVEKIRCEKMDKDLPFYVMLLCSMTVRSKVRPQSFTIYHIHALNTLFLKFKKHKSIGLCSMRSDLQLFLQILPFTGQQPFNNQENGAAGGGRARALYSFTSTCDEELSLRVVMQFSLTWVNKINSSLHVKPHFLFFYRLGIF